jgi:hypothetical protein
VSERFPNEPIALSCPASITTTEGQATSAGVSATDPDGTVSDLAVSAVIPTDPGTISVSGFSAAPGNGGTASGDVAVSAATPAGSYTASVTATNSDASPQTASCDVPIMVEAAPPPPPPPTTVDGLRAMVAGDVADGSLAGAKAFLLENRLDRAAADEAAGRMDAFRAQLAALGNQAAGLAPRWMTTAAADALRDAANEVAASA